jgi:hypothetical protein
VLGDDAVKGKREAGGCPDIVCRRSRLKVMILMKEF